MFLGNFDLFLLFLQDEAFFMSGETFPKVNGSELKELKEGWS
jgi:hypothetical protein